MTPFRGPLRPEEVAKMIVYVNGERAAATNGTALRVVGRVVRGIRQ